jgi:hypothetical protein
VLGLSSNNITVGSVLSGSVIVTLYISYSSVTTAYAGAALLNTQQVVFMPSLGPFTIVATVNVPNVSNICFPAGTPVQTDQGVVSIEQLDTGKYTIGQQPILHVTKTITLDPYLIAFAPHSIKRNCPTQMTVMSKDHQVMYNGNLVPAYRFLNYSKHIKKVKYSGEVLYNVLLPTYSTLRVNNLVCETLHPENRIAKALLSQPLSAKQVKKVAPNGYARTTF